MTIPPTLLPAGFALAFLCVPPLGGDELDLPKEEETRAEITGTIQGNEGDAADLESAFVDDLGVDADEYASAISDHVLLVAKVDEDSAQQLVQISEYVYRKLNWITFKKPEMKTFRGGGGKHVFFLVDEDSFEDTVVFLSSKYPQAIQKKGVREILKISDQIGGMSLAKPVPMHFTKTPDNMSSTVANGMGHHWLSWTAGMATQERSLEKHAAPGRGRTHLMNWFLEGVGMWASLDAIGRNRFFRITRQEYQNVGREDKGKDTDFIAMAYEIATGQVGGDKPVKNFYQLTRAKLNRLSDLDLAMSWSIVDYLIRGRLSDWRGLIKKCGGFPAFRVAFVAQFGNKGEKERLKTIRKKTRSDRALDELYREVCERFESAWKRWVAKEYREIYDDPSKAAREAPFAPLGAGGTTGDDEDDEPKPRKKRKKRRRRH